VILGDYIASLARRRWLKDGTSREDDNDVERRRWLYRDLLPDRGDALIRSLERRSEPRD